MRTIAHPGAHELEVRKSRFICTLERVASEGEAKAFVSTMRKHYWDANHNCTAWVIGSRGELQRSNDDGEPSGTAGMPMLNVLNQRQLTDVVAVVTRYFGGTLLGAGGLIRAYGQSVSAAIDAVGIVERKELVVILVRAGHDLAGKLDFALRGSPWFISDVTYGVDVAFELRLEPPDLDIFEAWLGEATSGQCAVELVGRAIVEVPLQPEP
ncbi:MAG: YigZ family protein [Thermomicrobiales bacterium]